MHTMMRKYKRSISLFLTLLMLLSLVSPTMTKAASNEGNPPVFSGVEDNGIYKEDVKITIEKPNATAKLDGKDFTNEIFVNTEGKHVLIVTEQDGTVTTANFIIDKTAPVTLKKLDGTYSSSWYTSDVKVTLSIDKDLSGLQYTKYRLNDDKNWTDYEGPFDLTTEGTVKVEYYSVDNAGNEEVPQTLSIKIDKFAPTAKIQTVTGVKGDNDWYTSDATVKLIAVDNNSGAKLSACQYRLVGGEWTGFSQAINFVDQEGIFPIEYKTTDNAGNSSEGQKLEVKIDKTAPVTTKTVTGKEGTNGWYTTDITVDLSAEDNLSGVQSIQYKLNGEENWTDYKGPISLTTEGPTKIEYHSVDKAGNIEETKTFDVKIKKVAPKVTGVVDDGSYNKDVTIKFDEGTATLNGKDIANNFIVSEEGSYTLVVTDEAGNKTTVEFTIDKTAPIVTGVENNGIYNNDVTIKFDEGTATLNGKDIANNYVVSEEGTFKLIVSDKAGNETIVEFTIDKTAPQVTGVENGGSYNKDVTIKFDEGTATLNGNAFASGTAVKAEGSYELVVIDDAGNKTIVKFTIDKKAPVVSGVKNNGLYNKDVTITFDKGQATLNGKEVKTKTAVKTNGTFTLVVTDAAGNKTTVKFTIDKIAPNAPKINQVSDKLTKVTGKTEANATVTLYIAGKKQNSVTADKSGNYSFTIKKQKAGTQIKVTATDKAGNVSKETAVKVVDKTPPVTPKVDKVTVKSTKVTGKAEAGSTVKVKVGNKVIGTATANKSGKFSVKIAKQKAGKALSVTATDKAKNVSKAAKVTVKKK